MPFASRARHRVGATPRRHAVGNHGPGYRRGVEVVALRRYPVKAMGGEALETVVLDRRGLAWDRWYAVVDAEGRFASGKSSSHFRRRDAVFQYAAAVVDGVVTVTRGDRQWLAGDPQLDAHLSGAMGDEVRVLPEGGISHQDDSPLTIIGTASLRWCAERFGDTADPRRPRMNIVVETDEPFVEQHWREVAVGGTRLQVVGAVPRCRMLDIEQDGVRPTTPWLQPLARERDMELGAYAEVAAPGAISVGDELRPA